MIKNIIVLLIFCGTTNATNHHPQDFLKTVDGTDNEGEKIVQHFCSNCHAKKPLIPLGAPRINVEEDWRERVKLGLDKMLEKVDIGFNTMPSRGGCFECTDKQLQLAIIAMLPTKMAASLKAKK